MSPVVEVQRYEFRAVITPNSLGFPSLAGDAMENIDDLRCFEPVIDLQSNTLATKDIDYRQEPDLRAVSEHVVHEVHRPTLIRCRRMNRRVAHHGSASTARCLCANR